VSCLTHGVIVASVPWAPCSRAPPQGALVHAPPAHLKEVKSRDGRIHALGLLSGIVPSLIALQLARLLTGELRRR
jgi:hypothetical protein